MASETIRVSEISGLTPAVDPAVANGIFALSGRNYTFDSLGPKSPFGNRLLSPVPRDKPAHTQGIRIKLAIRDRAFTIDGDGIFEWSESARGMVLIYATPDTSQSPHRWTWAYLAGFIFFCHPSVGLIALNTATGVCVPAKTIGTGVPEEVIAITENNGRLITIGPLFYSWSAPSNGLDYEPTLGGGGFQLISDRVSGTPIMVTSYARGCFTWTTGGVLRSEFTGDAAVYRHKAIATEYRPINSFCSLRVDDDTVVILDERGLFQSKGETPTPFAPMFNEFLISYIKRNKLTLGQNVRLEWDELQRLMYVSLSASFASPLYEQCFVLYQPLDKWGQFNEPHYGILPIKINDSDRAGDFYGFIDAQACVRYWQATGSTQRKVADTLGFGVANLVQAAIQKPVSYQESGTIQVMGASGRINTVSKAVYTKPAGYFTNGVNALAPIEINGLDAQLRFGLIRRENNFAPDQMSEIIGITMRSSQSGDEDQVKVDFNTIPDATANEDYNALTGSDDYGLEVLTYVNHKLEVIGTLDGVTEFLTATPTLVSFTQGARYYTCSVIGVWHIVDVSAVDVGESFHIKTFEINIVDAGRML